ncbi:hypothetical protein [Thermomonas fusca]|uniref:Uncharacterized protein n=1 Tax=Thermomonas fusca TaxID=215690 RepID=A0A5R9PD58_9GAMM|nr:hypothetical protein [Thermomonas fusca]TLX20973.1 hypothetical protein E5S66_12270 [Thermomonas fusca]
MSNQKRKAISLVSGVVARSRAGRKHSAADEAERAFLFRSQLSAAMMDARVRVSQQAIPKFFGEVARLTAFENLRFSKSPVGYSYLRLLMTTEPRTLKFELSWLAERIRNAVAELNDFIALKGQFEQSVLKGKMAQALSELNSIEERHGASLWSISLRVAILQDEGGDEAQKDFTATLRKTYPKAILPFYLRHLSERAERSVPIGWYLENVKRRIDRFKDDDLKTYLLFKVLEEWPRDQKKVAAILRIEQNHHLIDIYETLVSLIQHLAASSEDASLRKHLTQIVERISGIEDFRIEKIRIRLGMQTSAKCFLIDDCIATDRLISGDIVGAYRALRHEESAARLSGFTILLQGLALSVVKEGSAVLDRRPGHLYGRASHAMGRASIDGRNDDDGLADTARKIGHVYSGLSSCASIRYFQLAIAANSAEKQFEYMSLASANCEHLSFIDFSIRFPSDVATDLIGKLKGLVSRDVALCFQHEDHLVSTSVDEAVAAYALCTAAHNAGRFDDVERNIGSALTSKSTILSSAASTIALSAFGANGNFKSSAELVSAEVAIKARAPESLPIVQVFSNAAWRDIAPFSEDVAMSNALAALADIDSTDTTRTNRIFALQKVLRGMGVELPSDLKEVAKGSRQQEFVYFLLRACSMDVLDMLTSLESSMAVLEQRREIYSVLLDLDPANSDEYRYQILSISKEIRISQGLKTIDATRIHVDAPAIRSMLRRDLAESFARYLQLTKDGDANPESFDAILRDIAKPEQLAKHLLFPKETEADDLLFTMIGQARDRFLFNVPHGLDSYLSKRVRHGSIVGHLRAPAEAEGMITQQDRDGRYKENTRWAHAISLAKSPAEMQRAFLSFARSLDQHLLRLKDVLLHVKCEEKPLGLLDVRLQPIQYRLIRSVALQDRTLDTFLETMMGMLRAILNSALVGANTYIVQETSGHVDTLFQQLRTTVQQQLPPCAERYDMNAAINRASTNVQAAVTSAASWFAPTTVDDVKFTMDDAFDIALISVRTINPDFEPDISFEDESGLQFTVNELPFMQDVLFEAIGNVAKHAHLKAPSVEIHSRYSIEHSLLTIEVLNDISPEVNLEQKIARLAELKPILRDADYLQKARTEGDSGIPKLASTVFQSEHGELEFDVTPEGRFSLTFSLSVNSAK